jgi:hypothetical protein
MLRYRHLALFIGLTLTLTLILPLQQAQSSPPAAHSDSAFGVNSHLGSRYPVYESLEDPLAVLQRTGTGVVREEFQLSLVDRSGTGEYDWNFLDTVITNQASHGMTIIGLLNDAPGNAPPDTQRFVQFARTAVERYRDEVQYWEVWNEPENALYWNPPDPAGYARLLQAVYPAIKAANPNAQVLMAGIVPTHPDFLRGVAQNGGWDSFDILALHPYVDPWSPESGQIGVGGDVSKIKAVVEQFGRKPIWATEFGWSTGPSDRITGNGRPVDKETQANYLVRGAVLLRIAGMERVVWYNFKDTATRNLYGLIDYDGAGIDYVLTKPSLAAFTTLNEQLAGTTPDQSLQVGDAQVVLDFEDARSWEAGQGKGSLTHTSGQGYNSNGAGALNYNFASAGNDFEGFSPPSDISIPGSPRQMGIWVKGNGSGHELKVWLRDAENEVLQFRLGVIGPGDWRFVSTPLTQQVEDWNRISGSGNLRLDYPISLVAFILDDNPNTETGSGTFYIDNLTAMGSAYGVRFNKGSEAVDVLWAVQNEQVRIPTNSSTGMLVDRSGGSQRISASNGEFVVNLGPAPVYLTHTPGGKIPSAEQPAPASTPTPDSGNEPTTEPTPTPSDSGGSGTGTVPTPSAPQTGEECFDDTGYCISGRIREYWHQNGGLPVFGYPIGPQQQEMIEGQPLQVQWFERNRLELHPQNARPYDVLLGRLSEELLYADGRVWQDNPRSSPQSGCKYFEQTGFNVCGEILEAWRANGLELDGRAGKTEDENMALFGLPLGDAAMETIEGEQYLVQWFERARFEVHPENEPPYNVLFGLLGNETLLGE